MADINFVAGEKGLDFTSAVEAIVKRSCIIDFGIVQKVRDDAKGIVDVSLAVARTKQDIVIMTCVLANIASEAFTLDIIPKVGDRVLVVYPRAYDEKMFTIPDSDSDKTNIIVNERVKGYSLTAGIAILFNQYKTASHKNLIQIEEGKLSLKLGYNKEDDVNNLTIDTTEEGAVSIGIGYDKDNDKDHLIVTAGADGAVEVKNDATDLQLGADGAITANVSYDSDSSEYKATATIGADGYLSYTHKKDAKTALTFTSSGMTLQDKNGCNIESDNSGVTINGKLFIKA